MRQGRAEAAGACMSLTEETRWLLGLGGFGASTPAPEATTLEA